MWRGVCTGSRPKGSGTPPFRATEPQFYIHVPVSPSSIIWYQPMGGDVRRLGRYNRAPLPLTNAHALRRRRPNSNTRGEDRVFSGLVSPHPEGRVTSAPKFLATPRLTMCNRLNTAGAPEPSFSHVRPGVSLSSFCSVNVDDVITAISHLPDESSAADPLPVSVMKMVAAELAPFLTELFNRSMSAGHFPATFKEAFITPAIKKPGLDAMDAQSYRPISNLTVVSKLLERIVARQLQSYTCSHLISYRLFSPVFDQATQQKLPSLRVMSDLLEAVDSGDVAALVFLDLSAVCCLCDTVDHGILYRRLRVTFGLDGPAVLAWFHSYLHGRSQCVRRGMYKSPFVQLVCGVPQGSVLGPILFIMYTADLIALAEQHGFCPHLYTDDTQIYGSTRPPAIHGLQQRLSACIDDVHSWMSSNRLQLNTKTELLWCATTLQFA